MSELSERILQSLDSQNGILNSFNLSKNWEIDHQKIVGAVKSLEALPGYVNSVPITESYLELTEEGRKIVKDGSHEYFTHSSIPLENGIPQKELLAKVSKVGFSKAMSLGWIVIDKSDPSSILVRRKIPTVSDVTQEALKYLSKLNSKLKDELKKRKLLIEVVIKSYNLSKGPEFSLTIKKGETDLTPEMIASGSWKETDFKPYNFNALGIQPTTGNLHPLMKVRAEYRQIFLEMGFKEMPTNNFIESSFWNFDALFQPQQHPARDAHDTFFISDPAESSDFPKEYLEKVKKVHSEGGFGSKGYGYDWSIHEAKKNLLRTHTTAVSARMLYQLMHDSKDEFKPQKYFSIDRVFRNETLDATHLAEFHQIEGVIADRGLTLGDLIGILHEFFKKLGIEKLRFKPAYNPYTEPSMEIFSYHDGLKIWVEIGNSGVFRPEMLLPMGLPEDVTVIAWGLSLERPTMIKYGIDNIRDLCGHKINLKMVAKNPICRLDKDSRRPLANLLRVVDRRWTTIESVINQITKKYGISLDSVPVTIGNTNPSSFVVFADPKYPPFSIVPIINSLKDQFFIRISLHVHSDTPTQIISNIHRDFFALFENKEDNTLNRPSISLKMVWKPIGMDSTLILNPLSSSPIKGEINLIRYFIRLMPNTQSHLFYYNEKVTDFYLDYLHMNVGRSVSLSSKSMNLSCVNDFLTNIFIWSLACQKRLKLDEATKKNVSKNIKRDEFIMQVMHHYKLDNIVS
uniref:phenylalanine--tRNA ligase n=2 Tax=Lepeophtheirus salmonis TaxID=72036 RepID=A0A0K2TLJ3_LEPSM